MKPNRRQRKEIVKALIDKGYGLKSAIREARWPLDEHIKCAQGYIDELAVEVNDYNNDASDPDTPEWLQREAKSAARRARREIKEHMQERDLLIAIYRAAGVA